MPIKTCKICFKNLTKTNLYTYLDKEYCICDECLKKLNSKFIHFSIFGVDAISIYDYDETIKGLLYQFKGCGDYELKNIFLDYYNEFITAKYHGYTMIPAPSSDEAEKERGFNQVVEMFLRIKLPMMRCIHKVNDVKQHTLTSKERSEIKNLLCIDDVDLSKKKILIVDDVYTTGSTVKTMISLIKTKNPKRIEVLVMSKTIDLDLR